MNIDSELIENMIELKRVLRAYLPLETSVSELTAMQLETLIFLSKNHNSQMHEIAEHFHITKPSATSMLNTLSNAKLVKRIKNDTDRRAVHIQLTSYGSKLLDKSLKERRTKIQTLLDNLESNDKKELLRIINNLVVQIKKTYEN
jgi:DNA-binding MarR family transcriptional regulator